MGGCKSAVQKQTRLTLLLVTWLSAWARLTGIDNFFTYSYFFDTWAGPDEADPVRWIIRASTNGSGPMTQVAVSNVINILQVLVPYYSGTRTSAETCKDMIIMACRDWARGRESLPSVGNEAKSIKYSPLKLKDLIYAMAGYDAVPHPSRARTTDHCKYATILAWRGDQQQWLCCLGVCLSCCSSRYQVKKSYWDPCFKPGLAKSWCEKFKAIV